MEKTISTRTWAIIKRTAQNVNPLVQRKQRIQNQIADLAEEYKSLDSQIQGFEQGIKALCGGLGTEQLVVRMVTPVEGKFDKDGKQLRKVSYEPSANVHYNAEQNTYTITIPEEMPQGSAQEESSENEKAQELPVE